MRGERLRNAVAGASVAVDHLGEGDVVSVIAFDSRPLRVVPATTITAGNREQIKSAIRGITVGGDACLSCGIDDGISWPIEISCAPRTRRPEARSPWRSARASRSSIQS